MIQLLIDLTSFTGYRLVEACCTVPVIVFFTFSNTYGVILLESFQSIIAFISSAFYNFIYTSIEH